MTMTIDNSKIKDLLGSDANALLSYEAKGFNKSLLHLPGPDFVDRVVAGTDRSPNVLRNFNALLNNGRLAGTG
jgi:fructose-bisphosphate aldolase, class I